MKRRHHSVWQVRPANIEQPRQKQTRKSRQHRNSSEDQLSRDASLWLRAFSFLLRRNSFARLGMLGIYCGRSRAKYRPQKLIEVIVSAQRSRPSNPSAHDRKHREDHQWHKHNFRTLVNSAWTVPVWRGHSCPRIVGRVRFMPVCCFRLSAILTEEGHKPKPEHIERCNERSHNANQPIQPAGLVRSPEDFVFTEETG